MSEENVGGLTREDKIEWMKSFASKHRLTLVLQGSCGFGRECVGVLVEKMYPDYEWYGEDYRRIDNNGDVWTPTDAYHKHPCVAVLGVGEYAESQLYEWLQWFDKNGFVLEVGDQPNIVVRKSGIRVIQGPRYARMVRTNSVR